MRTDNKVQRKSHQRKCPNCGAPLRYNPASGRLACDHCKSETEFFKSDDVVEREFSELLEHVKWNESEVSCYRCKNCGASAVLPRTTLATTCPYCSSPVVIDENDTGLVRPDSLVPFELTRDDAERQLGKWKRRKAYAPNSFRRNGKACSITGVYTPAWTFDLVTSSHYYGRLGRTCTRTVRYNGKTHTETYVKWFDVDGVVERSFDDVFVSGNNHISVNDFDGLELTDQAKYVVYGDEYLQGYVADNYTVEPNEAYGIAKSKVDSQIYTGIMDEYDADHDGGLKVDTVVVQRSFKYMLLPVYVANCTYRGKVYSQYVSGLFCDDNKSVARVRGKAPVSPWKVLVTVLVCLAAVAGIIAAVILTSDNWLPDLGNGWDLDFKLLPKLLRGPFNRLPK